MLLCAAVSTNAMALTAKESEDANRQMIELERANTDVVIDALKQANQTIKVKQGSVIEIRFPEMYRGKDVWWYDGKTGASIFSFLIEDFRTTFENGFAMIHKPGTKLFRFRVDSKGTMTMRFNSGTRSLMPERQRQEPVSDQVLLTIEVD